MLKSLFPKLALAGLAVLVCVDTAEAGRRRKNKDCCCSPTPCCYANPYGSATPTYADASNCCAPAGGYAVAYGVTPMPVTAMPSTSSYQDPNLIPGAGALTAEKARLRVQVPTAETRIWVDQRMIAGAGMDRSIEVPLVANSTQKAVITAQWIKDGREVVRKKEVELKSGQEISVTFSDADTALGATGEHTQNPTTEKP